jgi:ubiquinone/menaquinone biosynthesis C-methylase UbiE
MSVRGRIEAALYDRMMVTAERVAVAEMRARLLKPAAGRVLEIGAGTGLNLARYPEAVTEIVLTEPEPAMARKLERKLGTGPRPARIVDARAESLPFEDESFDTAVSTLVLCSVKDQAGALAEIRRVLKPGGRFLFLEHVRSESPRLARWQDRLNPVWRAVANGCNCNRDTLAAIEAAGFEIEERERGELRVPKAPPLTRPYVLGRAIR